MLLQFTCPECGRSFERPHYTVKTKQPCCSRQCQNIRIGKMRFGVPRIGVPSLIFNADGLTVRIPLHSQSGEVRTYAIIDAADAEWAGQWRWFFNGRHVVRNHNDGVSKFTVYLHRELLGLPRRETDPVGDHIDRDTLNNRRANLRAIPQAGNMQNVTGHSASGYRGVSFHRQSGQWRARVKANGIECHIGLFRTPEEAAEAARVGRARLLPFAVD